MNALQVDPKTGYLESPSNQALTAFNADKKVRFMEIAEKCMMERKEMPTIYELCELIGIHRHTFEDHLARDSRFKAAWDNLLLKGQDVLVDVMYRHGKKDSGYMDRITWLRRHFPQHWNPEYKVTTEVNHTFVDQLSTHIDAIDGEIISDNTEGQKSINQG